MLGAYGSATTGNSLYTLRTLDWPLFSPMLKTPVIVVYKPTTSGSYPFTNIGFAGIIGAVTVVNN